MREINGIVYGDTGSQPIEVLEAKALSDMMLLVTFNTGEQKLYDATILLSMPAFQKLKDEQVFAALKVENGVVTWDNGEIDIAPESLYTNSFLYEPRDILLA